MAWLSTDESAQKELCFEKLSKGWAIGSKDFKRELLEDIAEDKITGVENAVEGRELLREKKLGKLKSKFSEKERQERAKCANWKVAVAAMMKKTTTASNRWLSEQLDMGDLKSVSRLVGE